MQERVQKLMANAGFCSRRKAEELIAEGKVFVNGEKIKLGDKADPKKDEVRIAKTILEFEKKRYLALYKPRHVLTSLSDPSGKTTIKEFIEELPERVFPIGRLDYDAEGLLLLTNDGDFANNVMHPRYETSKTYHAQTREKISEKQVKSLVGTMRLKDGKVRIQSAKRINPTTVELVIHEGRNKIVKRIFKQLGFYVGRLKRVQIGPVRLGRLKPGMIRNLRTEEIEALKKSKKK